MNYVLSTRPADMPDVSTIARRWHTSVNDHPWLLHADVIMARAAMYTEDAARHALMLATEARACHADGVALELETFAEDAFRASEEYAVFSTPLPRADEVEYEHGFTGDVLMMEYADAHAPTREEGLRVCQLYMALDREGL